MDFIAAAVGKREGGLSAADAGQFGRQVDELVGDHMDDVAFALDAALARPRNWFG